MIPLRQLVPGVRPFEPDSLVYHVKSASRAIEHKVDLTDWSGFGSCSCEKFQFKFAPLLREGMKLTESMECQHLQQVRRYVAIEVAQQIITKRMIQANANRKRFGHNNIDYERETGSI